MRIHPHRIAGKDDKNPVIQPLGYRGRCIGRKTLIHTIFILLD